MRHETGTCVTVMTALRIEGMPLLQANAVTD